MASVDSPAFDLTVAPQVLGFIDSPSFDVVVETQTLGYVDSPSVNVTVAVQPSTIAISGQSTVSINEGQTALGNYNVTGATGSIAWSITGADQSFVSVVGGIVSLDNPSDYDAKNSYSYTVNVTDDLGTASINVTATILDVYENVAPVVQNQTFTILDSAEVGDVVGKLQAQDVEDVTFSLVSGIGLSAFSINGDDLVVNEPLDFNIQPSYSLLARATDTAGLFNDFGLEIELVEFVEINDDLVDISELYNDVRLAAPSATNTIIQYHARQVLIDFCKESKFWRADINTVPVNSLASRYRIEYSGDTAISSVYSAEVTLNDGSVRPNYTDYAMLSPTVIELSDHANIATLNAVVVLLPTQTTTQVPTALFDQYFDVIVSGIKAEVLALNGKDWHNPQLSSYYKTKYEEGRGEARRLSNQSYDDDSVRRERVREYF